MASVFANPLSGLAKIRALGITSVALASCLLGLALLNLRSGLTYGAPMATTVSGSVLLGTAGFWDDLLQEVGSFNFHDFHGRHWSVDGTWLNLVDRQDRKPVGTCEYSLRCRAVPATCSNCLILARAQIVSRSCVEIGCDPGRNFDLCYPAADHRSRPLSSYECRATAHVYPGMRSGLPLRTS